MSETWTQGGPAVFTGQAANDGATAGVLLRRAREAAGLHVAALAVSLKVPVRKLEALEDDRYDELTDAVFVRALAASVCRNLKIDPQPVLERLPQTVAPRLARNSEGLNAPFRAPSDAAPPSWFDQLTRPVYLAVFALLLGALVLVLLPTSRSGDGASAIAQSQPAAQPQPQPSAEAAPIPAAPPIGAPAEASPAVLPSAPPPQPSGQAITAVVSPAAASAVAAEPAAAEGTVVFKAKGSSWIEVTDAKGVVAVRRLLAAGEAVGASGAMPLQVTIGRVDQTEVEVRGKPFDLRPVSRDNVARFEVK